MNLHWIFLMLFLAIGVRFTNGLSSINPPASSSTWHPSAWKAALSDLSTETRIPTTLPISGTVPPDLSGILYKNGPAKFTRQGQPYAHWLEGDGAVIRLEFNGQDGTVTFTSRLVQTDSFQADETAGAITVRGTFGTNKNDGTFNAFDLRLKNPSNTNAVRIGDKVLALSEVGLPFLLNATTLETLGRETFDSRFQHGVTAATVGIPALDKILGFGSAVMAHVRYVPFRDSKTPPHLVMIGAQQHALTGDTEARILELDDRSGTVLGDLERVVLKDTGFPAHDFICTLSHAVWVTCPAQGDLTPFILGKQGPAQCLSFRKGATSTLHLVERRVGTAFSTAPATVKRFALPRPIHPIHYGGAWESLDKEKVTVYLTGWDTESLENMMQNQESMLGSWSAIRSGDFSDVKPQPLLKVTVQPNNPDGSTVTVERVAKESIDHIDFLKGHPLSEGRPCRYLYGVVSTPPKKGTPSGIGPPQTICIIDLESENIVEYWFAGPNNILDDFILVPKGNDERSAWLVAPCFKGETATTSFVVLDASNLSQGPVCEAHLDHFIPWALHGTWWPTKKGS